VPADRAEQLQLVGAQHTLALPPHEEERADRPLADDDRREDDGARGEARAELGQCGGRRVTLAYLNKTRADAG
jgi:hypothetical protein